MRTIKANLPEGVRKTFDVRIGRKVRLVNKDNFRPKKKTK